jgi:hypothetical protein
LIFDLLKSIKIPEIPGNSRKYQKMLKIPDSQIPDIFKRN